MMIFRVVAIEGNRASSKSEKAVVFLHKKSYL